MSSNKEMIKIIEVLNKLQDKLVSLGVNDLVKELPQIAVVGSQSAGKSSVLESFVGRDFLPRGGDIVTRRPLILQLKQNTDDSRTYAKFGHSSKEYTDFDEIKQEIQAETDRTVPNSGISSDPINLKITSPDVLDLNLIDLPGMTKVPVGDQPENIELIVKDLINPFIKNENCLILAVTPANQDLSTSDAIKLSREVDPFGKRTIGVLTKLDLMDKGTNARQILLNEHKIKLKRGFIGVICRSPKEIENNKELSEAIADEKEYLSKHPDYKDIMHRMGIENLQKYLQKELAKHLFTELPALRNKFIENLVQLNDSIEKTSFTINKLNPNDLISNTIEIFKQKFRDEIGTGDDVPVDRNNGGTNINIQMNIKYAEDIEMIVRNENKIKREISLAIKNIYGVRVELFVPNKAFSIVVRKQIESMRLPSLVCVESVYVELGAIVRNGAKQIGKFPKLINLYTNTTLEFLRECKERCKEMVDHKMDIEKDYLSANQVDLIKTLQTEKMKSNQTASVPQTTVVFISKSGWINYDGVRYFFSLENRTLTWYSDSYLNNHKYQGRNKRGSIDLKGVNAYCFKKCIMLIKADFQMKLEFYSNNDTVEWGKAILDNAHNDTDIDQDDNEKLEDDDDPGPGNVKYPISIKSQVEEVKNLVLDHVKVTEQTLKNYIPKLCQKELIDATEQFVSVTLRNYVQNKELTIDDLVDRDPMEEELNDLLMRKSHYEETLQVMNEVMNSSIIT